MSEHLFSYGTLQTGETQRALFGRELAGAKDALLGHRPEPIEITDPAFLARGERKHQRTTVPTGDPADVIDGTVFAVTADELRLCDRYEPASYARFKVRLRSGKEAWLYADAARFKAGN